MNQRTKFDTIAQILDFAQGDYVSIYEIMRHLGVEHGRLKRFLSQLEHSRLIESKTQDKSETNISQVLGRWAAKIHESGNWQKRKLYRTTHRGLKWLSQFETLKIQVEAAEEESQNSINDGTF